MADHAIDEFYESIRAPKFYDFCLKNRKDNDLDTWFGMFIEYFLFK